MLPRNSRALRRAAVLTGVALCAGLTGCAVIAVADSAASLAISGAGLAADAAIGTLRLTGKAVGAAASTILPGGDQP